jgi:hypothetical protein
MKFDRGTWNYEILLIMPNNHLVYLIIIFWLILNLTERQRPGVISVDFFIVDIEQIKWPPKFPDAPQIRCPFVIVFKPGNNSFPQIYLASVGGIHICVHFASQKSQSFTILQSTQVHYLLKKLRRVCLKRCLQYDENRSKLGVFKSKKYIFFDLWNALT